MFDSSSSFSKILHKYLCSMRCKAAGTFSNGAAVQDPYIVVYTDADRTAILNCTIFNGTMIIDSSFPGDFVLPKLQVVDGIFIVEDVAAPRRDFIVPSNLTRVILPQLRTIVSPSFTSIEVSTMANRTTIYSTAQTSAVFVTGTNITSLALYSNAFDTDPRWNGTSMPYGLVQATDNPNLANFSLSFKAMTGQPTLGQSAATESSNFWKRFYCQEQSFLDGFSSLQTVRGRVDLQEDFLVVELPQLEKAFNGFSLVSSNSSLNCSTLNAYYQTQIIRGAYNCTGLHGTSNSTNTTSPGFHSKSKPSTGAKTGIGVGVGVTFIAMLALGIYLFLKKFKVEKRSEEDETRTKADVKKPELPQGGHHEKMELEAKEDPGEMDGSTVSWVRGEGDEIVATPRKPVPGRHELPSTST
ncbi:uncharacterized protein PAC_13686 [Phialocephala subalpina]|uniref:Uncharacterized protein n=1 Tax=Phialocephala subalpina TaxID=576137 RepID=A0A1L7XFG6_9HELO|nr:uncharacterized protein PAC_13686 [Phialocephala subalpina]